MQFRWRRGALGIAALALVCQAQPALSAESATSVYLLGSKGTLAGMTPPPGLYISDANYYYSGDASGTAAKGVTLRRTGTTVSVSADVSVEGAAYYNIPTALWVAPGEFLGGNAGFSVMMPIGWKDISAQVDATASLTLPPPLSITLSRGRSLAISDDNADFGDPLLSTFVGWHHGNLHSNLALMANIPVGQWDTGRLANIGFNHWAFDVTGALTWLDPSTGFELSGAAGLTFNTENPDTDYKSGTDFHLEFAAVQHFSKQLAVGVAGYHYDQITGDSGAGAVLGDFEGRVTGIGPQLNYDFAVGQLPVFTSVKWIHELEATNRLEGDMGFLTVTVPLGPPPAPPAE